MDEVYILYLSISRELSEIEYLFDEYRGTNIDFLQEGFEAGETEWSVPKKARPGDTVIFYCVKEARRNLDMATSKIPTDHGPEFRRFIEKQKALYKEYSGYLLGIGVICSIPEKDPEDKWWMAGIHQLRQFDTPISMDDFRDFISITQGKSLKLTAEKWERLRWIICRRNPGFFENVTPPYEETLEQEFKVQEQRERKRDIHQLRKEAEKKASKPEHSTVRTTVFHRDPTIAAYVKKRANGCCQLCEMNAPFSDENGNPYLECHHIIWLSAGGMDSVDNCVALCPNCHRKMHILNDPNDINALTEKASKGVYQV